MKRIIAFLLTVMMVLCLAACQAEPKNTEPTKNSGNNNQQTEPTKQQDTKPTDAPTQPAADWGVPDDFASFANGKLAKFTFRLPALAGIPKGSALMAYQPDFSLVIVDAHLEGETADISDVTQVLPTCFVQTEMTMDLYRNSAYDDFAFEVKSSEKVTINGYEMCKYTGVHTFTLDDQNMSFAFVAYATQLKTNGAYVYWMVLDETEGQTLGQTIADHAYKIALSLGE